MSRSPRRWMAAMGLALMVLPVATAMAQDLRKARIIDYDNGDRRLEWAEPPRPGATGAAPAIQRPASQPRTHGVPVAAGSGGGGGGAREASAGSDGGGAGGSPPGAVPGRGVELIVGGQGKDGIAKKSKVPVLE